MEIRKDLRGTANGKYGQPAAQSKLRELRQRARAACFVQLLSTKTPVFVQLLSTKTPVFVDRQHQKSTSVHEIVGSGGQNAKQPRFYVEPDFTLSTQILSHQDKP